MLFPGPMTAFNYTTDNWPANPTTSMGVSVTPGASNSEGSWTSLSFPSINRDCYWLYIKVHSGATSAAAKNHLLDIGIDAAGGSSYTAFIENLVVGCSPAVSITGSCEFLFPIFVKANSSLGVRIQGGNATAGTVRVMARLFGQPTNPLAVPMGGYAQTFGTITNSLGSSFTPGNAADGSWVDLGSVTRPLWWFQMGYQLNTSTITAEYTYIDVAWGDASNKQLMFRVVHAGTTAETAALITQTQMLACAAYNPVPAGANIYIRGRCSDSPDSGYNATVVGIGG